MSGIETQSEKNIFKKMIYIFASLAFEPTLKLKFLPLRKLSKQGYKDSFYCLRFAEKKRRGTLPNRQKNFGHSLCFKSRRKGTKSGGAVQFSKLDSKDDD